MLTSEIATVSKTMFHSFFSFRKKLNLIKVWVPMSRLQTTEAKLSATLFNDIPILVLFAEVSQQVVGFALYYFRYSSFAAQPSLWLMILR